MTPFLLSVSAVISPYSPEEDGLSFYDIPVTCACLRNSKILSDLDSFLSFLPDPCTILVRLRT